MVKGSTLTDKQKMERARENTRRSAARELWYGLIFSRMWPAWTHPTDNVEYPVVLVVDTPAGRLTWRIATDETTAVEHLETRQRTTYRAIDRLPTLQALAEHGWI